MPNIIECSSSELDYFTEKPYQNILRDGTYVEIKAAEDKTSILSFVLPASPAYMDLSKTSIAIRLKVFAVKAGVDTELTETDIVAPVNNFFHSLFYHSIVNINEEEVENSNNLYAYRAYITDTLNHGSEVKSTFLQNSLYYPDTAGEMDTFALRKINTKAEDLLVVQKLNHGFLSRRKILMLGNGEIEVRGIPHFDIFHNGKFILSQTKMRIDMYLNKPNFCLMGTGEFTFKILSASMILKKVVPNDNIQNSINIHLEKSFANFNLNRVILTSKQIENTGLTQTVEISKGIVPKRVILCFVDDVASTVGKIDKNPYNLEHFNLTSCQIMEGGQSVSYSKPQTFDFAKGRILDGYWTIFDGIDKPSIGNNISREDYANGYMFLAYDLTPNGECEPFNNIARSGDVSVNLIWSTKSEKPIKLIAYLEYDRTLKMDIYRNIII